MAESEVDMLTFWQHWRRGVGMAVVIGISGLYAMVAGVLATAVVFVPIELFASRHTAADLEGRYLERGIFIAAVLIWPLFLSQSFPHIALFTQKESS